MNNYVIYTDSACDIYPEVLAQWGVGCVSLEFRFDHIDKDFKNEDMPIGEFYQNMRDGHVAKTNAVNAETFREAFEPILKEGKDVLYLGFSSGLSTTFQQGKLAAEDLAEAYPDRKILAIDTLCASAGEGLIVKLALDKKNEGATFEETAAYVNELIPKLAHWFTVEDLVYLKRGGRISPTVAFVGNALGLKPMLCITDEGKLHSHSKARGRKKAIEALVERYGEYAEDAENGTVFISHADCEQDAREVGEKLKARFGVEVKLLTQIGPVIGSHAGPGTIALCFVGTNR